MVICTGAGCLPDPPDKRDEEHRFAHLVSRLGAPLSLPEEASLQAHVHGVLDQGPLNSCVANAVFQAFRIRHSALGNRVPLGSRLFGYFLARASHDSADADIGTYNRALFAAVDQFGFLPEADYPYRYDWLKVNTPPPPVVSSRAYDQRSARDIDRLRYRRITEVGDELIDRIMQAIALDMPVVFGTEVSRDFVEGKTVSELVQEPPPPLSIAGGHAMVIIAYNGKGHFLVLSSWSARWGIDGYCWMSAAYLKSRLSRDFWVVDKPPFYSSRSPA